MFVLYFAFANDKDQPLDELKEEYLAIERLLRPLADQGLFRLEMRPYADLPTVMADLATYRDRLRLFHFSGHAGPGEVLLEDGAAGSKGVGAQLGECPHLELVVLNGCATAGQVEGLQSRGVRAVIATAYKVADDKARLFSEVLYRLLAHYQPLPAAWKAAANAVLAKDGAVTLRGIGFDRGGERRDSDWGLYALPGHEALIDTWTLTPADEPPEEPFEPNSLLIPTLAEALAASNPVLADLVQREREGRRVSLYRKREQIVRSLPRPIGTGIRSLVSEPTHKEAGGHRFYNQEDENRLGQLLLVFEIATELQAFVMLAQLWKELDPAPASGKPPLRLAPDEAAPVQAFLQRERQNLHETMSLIRHLRQLFDRQRITYFLKELAGLKEKFLPGQPFHNSARWLADLHLDLNGKLPTPQQGRALCAVTERHLCRVLGELGFLAHYLFASVKKIDVKKYRDHHRASYEHEVVQLVSDRITGDGEDYVERSEYFDIKSVLLLKGRFGDPPDLETEIEDDLNLSPFVIDQNAFDAREASLAKLYFFRAWRPEAGVYQYRFIDLLKDRPLIVSGQLPATSPMYYVLKRQFDHFIRLLSIPKTEADAQPV